VSAVVVSDSGDISGVHMSFTNVEATGNTVACPSTNGALSSAGGGLLAYVSTPSVITGVQLQLTNVTASQNTAGWCLLGTGGYSAREGS
jgi:hypothetical protein